MQWLRVEDPKRRQKVRFGQQIRNKIKPRQRLLRLKGTKRKEARFIPNMSRVFQVAYIQVAAFCGREWGWREWYRDKEVCRGHVYVITEGDNSPEIEQDCTHPQDLKS